MPPISIAPGTTEDVFRQLGRARVFYVTYWAMAANLVLAHLGDTEGEIGIPTNEELEYLTATETTGNSKLEAYVKGGDPVATIPLYLADPSKRALLTPRGGSGGAGRSRRVRAKYYTLVLIPEGVFEKEDGTLGTLTYVKTPTPAWKLDGVDLTADQLALLDMSVWAWRCHFVRPPIKFTQADGDKTVDQVTVQIMHDATKPEGEMLYTRGDPADVGIDIQPVTS